MEDKSATVCMSRQLRSMFHNETVKLHPGYRTDDVGHPRYVIGARSLGHCMQKGHRR